MADEHDACALVAIVRKDARPARRVLADAVAGLECLAHRSGQIDGEADGAGILTDLPRELWAALLADAGLPSQLADHPRFAVAHILMPRDADDDLTRGLIRAILARHRVRVVTERHGVTRVDALGPRGRAEAPAFWQLAMLAHRSGPAGDRALRAAASDIEWETGATVASLSRSSVVYKVRGSPSALRAYYPDLSDPRFRTSVAFGHNRFSTNTATTFARVQPFGAFAHNGEINTIGRLRDEAGSLALKLTPAGSDSQDVDATLRGMVDLLGLDPIEAIELLFPPILNEIRRMPEALQDAYVQGRAALGPLAQGPAAFLARLRDVCVFGVDAMGLRPLWHVDTDDEHIFASERGFVPLARYAADPRPLGPGEHIALERGASGWRFLDETAVRTRFLDARTSRGAVEPGLRRHLECGGPADAPAPVRGGPERVRWEVGFPPDEVDELTVRREQQLAALGFEPDDLKAASFMEEQGAEPIGSLGYDGPLAALAARRPNLADFLHETVAVVTNPAIDREREIEHFSTRVLVGPRPLPQRGGPHRAWIELKHPVLLGGHAPEAGLAPDESRRVARRLGTWRVEDVLDELRADARGCGAAVLDAD
ncbi:MAG: glutamate synthase, partial [Chloroflexota bacterium]|nr:glutamate synthase [Chloroflexota bacterium]